MQRGGGKKRELEVDTRVFIALPHALTGPHRFRSASTHCSPFAPDGVPHEGMQRRLPRRLPDPPPPRVRYSWSRSESLPYLFLLQSCSLLPVLMPFTGGYAAWTAVRYGQLKKTSIFCRVSYRTVADRT